MAAAAAGNTTSCSARIARDTHCDCAGTRDLARLRYHSAACAYIDVIQQLQAWHCVAITRRSLAVVVLMRGTMHCYGHMQKSCCGLFTLLLLHLCQNFCDSRHLIFSLLVTLQRS